MVAFVFYTRRNLITACCIEVILTQISKVYKVEDDVLEVFKMDVVNCIKKGPHLV